MSRTKVDPIDVDCPNCTAKAGQQCMLSRTALGADVIHVARRELAEQNVQKAEDKREKALIAMRADFEAVRAARTGAVNASNSDYSHKVAQYSSEAGSFINKHFAVLDEMLGTK